MSEAKFDPLACPHCACPVFRATQDGTKIKASTNILVVHKSGAVEINCASCSRGIVIPLVPAEGPATLRKADDVVPRRQKFIVRSR